MAIELDQKPPRKRRPDTREISVVSVYDRFSTYPSHGLTPERVTSIFKEADQGDMYRQSELFEEILEKDPRLFGMFASRKLSVVKNEGEIIAAGKEKNFVEHADYVRKAIERIRNWRQAKEDILDAIPKGYSLLQIMWTIDDSKVFIDRLEWAHQKNLRFGLGSNWKSDPNAMRRLTDDNRIDGVDLEPNKWVVSVIKARSGHPSRTSILRTCTWMYLFKNFDVKAWIQFAEIFGMPLRVGHYNAAAGEPEKDALLKALQNLAIDASAMISDNTKIEFIETVQKAATASLHGDLASFTNSENSVAVLGHTGAAESTPGKLGQENAALEARFDLVESDALALDYIISDQIIRPLVDFQFGPQEKYPYHKTGVKKPVDRKELVEVYDGAINRLGLPVAAQHVYETLGIPQPKEGDELIQPRPQPTSPFPLRPSLTDAIAGESKKKGPA